MLRNYLVSAFLVVVLRLLPLAVLAIKSIARRAKRASSHKETDIPLNMLPPRSSTPSVPPTAFAEALSAFAANPAASNQTDIATLNGNDTARRQDRISIDFESPTAAVTVEYEYVAVRCLYTDHRPLTESSIFLSQCLLCLPMWPCTASSAASLFQCAPLLMMSLVRCDLGS